MRERKKKALGAAKGSRGTATQPSGFERSFLCFRSLHYILKTNDTNKTKKNQKEEISLCNYLVDDS